METPYATMGPDSFWKNAVGGIHPLEIKGLWSPKFNLRRKDRVVTFGSCFAQHIGRALVARGYNWIQCEKQPPRMLEQTASAFNYGVFSARTGNLYTVSLVNQWLDWALKDESEPVEYWVNGESIIDPFRPRIEPDGFDTVDEMRRSRGVAIKAFANCIVECDVFIFTLGLTESWFNRAGYEYPICPGAIAGSFDPKEHLFVNQTYDRVRRDLREMIAKLRRMNPRIRVILTVSPVPLTATNSGNHVLTATMESKAILRAAAGNACRELKIVDYFPSFEIIASHPFGGYFYEVNKRTVTAAGVEMVMKMFFDDLYEKYPDAPGIHPPMASQKEPWAEVCDEEILGSFA